MKEIKFRNLRADEVEVRVGGGGSLLLYKTARVDANILDETVGQANWQKKFYQVKNTMICSLGININFDNEASEPLWVWKDDAGDDDYTMEKVKAEASDSFKRAGFAWGIGRSLYSAPKIKIPDQFKGSQFFDVSELEYDSQNRICALVITTDFGKTKVYEFRNGRKVNLDIDTNPTTTLPKKDVLKEATKGIGDSFLEESAITQETKASIQAIVDKLSGDRYNDFKNWLSDNFGETNIGALSEKQGQQVLKSFTRGK